MSVRSSDLFELPPDAVRQLNEARQTLRALRVEIERMKASGMDTAAHEAQLAAAEASVAMFLEHYGPGSARRWAQKARNAAGG